MYFTNMGKAKPYKIVDCTGVNRYGVVASSLRALEEKGKCDVRTLSR